MNNTPAEDLARDLWPQATPEQIRTLSGALSLAFQKLKPSTGEASETFYKKTAK